MKLGEEEREGRVGAKALRQKGGGTVEGGERHRNSRTVLENEVGAGGPGFLGPYRHADFQLFPERRGSY